MNIVSPFKNSVFPLFTKENFNQWTKSLPHVDWNSIEHGNTQSEKKGNISFAGTLSWLMLKFASEGLIS